MLQEFFDVYTLTVWKTLDKNFIYENVLFGSYGACHVVFKNCSLITREM
jgi:hypothetical protein